jgi:hypothetical protein
MRLILSVLALALGCACVASGQSCPGGSCPRPAYAPLRAEPNYGAVMRSTPTYAPTVTYQDGLAPANGGFVPPWFQTQAEYRAPVYYSAPVPVYYQTVPSYNLPLTPTRIYSAPRYSAPVFYGMAGCANGSCPR